MKKSNVNFIVQAALIAALYVVLTWISAQFGLSSGAIQLRLSELLTVFPLFMPAAIPGLTIGCLLANLLTGCMLWDIVFGSIATLLGAVGTYLIGRKVRYPICAFLAPLPPIIANILIVPPILAYVYCFEGTIPYFALTVGIGEILSCGVLGVLAYFALHRVGFVHAMQDKIKKDR